jgi:hypothetical protein
VPASAFPFYTKQVFSRLFDQFFQPFTEACVKAEYQEDENRKLSQKINLTSAVAMLQQILVPSFVRRPARFFQCVDWIIQRSRVVLLKSTTKPPQ